MHSKLIISFFVFFLFFSCSKKEPEINIPAEKDKSFEIYQEAVDAMNRGDLFFASKKFSEAEPIMPKIEFSAKASLMSSYCLYLINFYPEATANLERFINQYNGIKAHGPVYFADATHPEFAPNITYGWIRKGSKFEVKTNSGWRKRVNIYGLIEINTLDVITRSFETINQFSVCEILRALRRKNPNDKNLYVVLDGASYNRSIIVTNIAKELKIKIVRLPPYSPNLNPIERLWKFMKSKVTANRYFEQFDDFKHTLMEFFRGIRKYKNELETLITDNFQILDPLEI